MGQRVTIAMQGRLQLSIDGSPTTRPLDVGIGGLELDLDYLMENELLKISDKDPSKVMVVLQGVTLTLALDADEVLSRGAANIVRGLEESM